jgi:glycerophosphoryl diester phosphodiesterase
VDVLEIQAHRGNDQLTLRRLLAAAPSSVEIDVGLAGNELVVAHDLDHGDATGLTVDRVLATAGETPVVVEVKCLPPLTPAPGEFAQALRPYLSRIAVASFDERVLEEVGRLRRVTTTFLFEQPLRVATCAATLGPRHDIVTRELVDAAHALGLRVVPWTVNDVRDIAALVDLGVDGLVTDEPALARAVAASRLPVAA